MQGPEKDQEDMDVSKARVSLESEHSMYRLFKWTQRPFKDEEWQGLISVK